jgi:HK97 gp10 family phage protein
MASPVTRTGLTMDQILKRLQDSSITVGVHKDTGSYDNGAKVTEVAAWNEFGTSKIPERSFLRSTIAENRAKYQREFQKAYLEAISGGMNLRAAAGFIGNVARDDIKAKIESISSPGNAPSTIAKKGFDNPLIETRKLYESVKWKYFYG